MLEDCKWASVVSKVVHCDSVVKRLTLSKETGVLHLAVGEGVGEGEGKEEEVANDRICINVLALACTIPIHIIFQPLNGIEGYPESTYMYVHCVLLAQKGRAIGGRSPCYCIIHTFHVNDTCFSSFFTSDSACVVLLIVSTIAEILRGSVNASNRSDEFSRVFSSAREVTFSADIVEF